MFAQPSTQPQACSADSSCFPAPLGFLPFQSVYYITSPNAAGDRLVVGKPFTEQQLLQWMALLPIPNTGPVGSSLCGLVQLAPGLAAEAYLPRIPERLGDFSSFGAPLIDPGSGQAFPGSIIPITRFGDVFAWRIHAPPAQALPPSYSAGSTNPSIYPLLQNTLNLAGDVALAVAAASAGVFACSTTPLLPTSLLDWFNGLPAVQGQYAVVSMSPVDLSVTDPLGRTTSRSVQGIPDSAYFELDFGGALPHPIDVVLIRASLEAQGNYKIGVTPDSTATMGDTFSLLTVSGTVSAPQVRVLAMDSPVPLGTTVTFSDAPLRTVSAASYAPPGEMAKSMIMISLASGLARGTAIAPGTDWPTQLLNTQVMITDSAGLTAVALLYYVDPGDVIFLVPPEIASGDATVTIQSGTGGIVSQPMVVENVVPSLFTANSSGSGVPAGFWIRSANGVVSQDYLFDPTKPVGNRVPVPVDLGSEGDQVYLSLYGTGFRDASQATATVGGEDVPVSGFAQVAAYQGEDVVNVGPLPRSLAGRGAVDVVITFDGKAANTVTASIR